MENRISERGENKGIALTNLAAVRTKLANDRTLLAYIRTALTLFVAGVTFIRFFDNRIIEIIGWVFIPFGIINVILGIARYNATKHNVTEINHES